MTTEIELPDEELRPVEFDLADGSKVFVELGTFSSKATEFDQSMDEKPVRYRYLAIRVYTDEGTHPRRLAMIHEFVHSINFEHRFCPAIWQWLTAHSVSRERHNHQSAEDFVIAFEEEIDQIQAAGEDMGKHYENLVNLTLPSEFDQIDDSIFTDQSDAEIR